MAVRKRGNVWLADYRDAFGIRRYPSFRTKAEALAAEAEGRLKARQ